MSAQAEDNVLFEKLALGTGWLATSRAYYFKAT
jgi:hypothetical protein